MSNCPLLEFSFPVFTLLSFWYINLSSHFTGQVQLALYILSLELLPFAKIKFSKLFFVALSDNDLNFFLFIRIDIIQIRYHLDSFDLHAFVGDMPFEQFVGVSRGLVLL